MTSKIIFFIALISITLTSCSQDFKVNNLTENNPNFSDGEYSFPILDGSNKTVTNRINSTLIFKQLDIDYGKEKNSIFENVWQKPDDVVAQLNYLTYQVELLNDKLYAVTISGEFCSAYCEGFDMTYTFDLNSGTLLTLDTLFNPKGQIKLLKVLIDHKTDLIQNKLEQQDSILKSNNIKDEEKQFHQDMISLYKDCNTEYSELKNFRFIPSQDSIKIIYGRCSAHYNRDIDELWYFQKIISTDEWLEQLSEIGKKYFK